MILKLRDGCGKDHIQGTVTKTSKGKIDCVVVKLFVKTSERSQVVTENILAEDKASKNFAVQWLGLSVSTARAGAQSLVRELRSHKLCGTANDIFKSPHFF